MQQEQHVSQQRHAYNKQDVASCAKQRLHTSVTSREYSFTGGMLS